MSEEMFEVPGWRLRELRDALTEVSAERDKLRAMFAEAVRMKEAAEAERDEALAALDGVRQAVAELLRREHQHAGHGRDGHLDETDIAIVTAALGTYAERTEDEVDRLTPTKIAKETQTDE